MLRRKLGRRLALAVASVAAIVALVAAAPGESAPTVPKEVQEQMDKGQKELDKIKAQGGFEKVKLGVWDPKTGKAEVDENGNTKLYTWKELHPDADRPPPAGTPILDRNQNIVGYSDGTR